MRRHGVSLLLLVVALACENGNDADGSATGGMGGTLLTDSGGGNIAGSAGDPNLDGGNLVGGSVGGASAGGRGGSVGTGGLLGTAGAGGESVASCQDLLDNRVGFGRQTDGGLQGDVYEVINLNDAGPGSLRAGAESDETYWIVFKVSGTIQLANAIQVRSNKTIDGRNADIAVTGAGFVLDDVSNVIVENLSFTDGEGDAITIYNAQQVWVDHCTFSQYEDGAVDITEGSTDVTVSWSRFERHGKVMLIGARDDATGDASIHVTVHHNYFVDTAERHPRLRFGRVHAFNNVVENWQYYAMRVHLSGELVSEHNIFLAGDNKDGIVRGDDTPTKVRSVSDLLLNGATVETNLSDQAFKPSDVYSYTLETADQSLRQRVQTGAGQREALCEY